MMADSATVSSSSHGDISSTKTCIDLSKLKEALSPIDDPRMDRKKLHSLFDIIGLTLIASICGADNWAAIQGFGEAKFKWLRKFLKLANGIPSHDTLSRVFALIEPDSFSVCLVEWLKTISVDGRLINIDGKTIKGSRDKSSGLKALHIVSAWAGEAGISIGQMACGEKSNEINAIPELLEIIDIEGKLVTIDAMGCQKKIAEKITDQGGDYVLGLKGNQGTLHESIDLSFEQAHPDCLAEQSDDCKTTIEKDHGRIEERSVYVFHNAKRWPETSRWSCLNSVLVADRSRTIAPTGEKSTVRQYYISSLKNPSAEEAMNAIRGHWGVENGLHWQLDVSFQEDKCRTVERNSAQNLSLIRKSALTLLNRTKAKFKCGVKNLRMLAGWHKEVAEQVLMKISEKDSLIQK